MIGGGEFGPEEFDGDALAALHIVGFVHLTEAAQGDEAPDLVALSEALAKQQ